MPPRVSGKGTDPALKLRLSVVANDPKHAAIEPGEITGPKLAAETTAIDES